MTSPGIPSFGLETVGDYTFHKETRLVTFEEISSPLLVCSDLIGIQLIGISGSRSDKYLLGNVVINFDLMQVSCNGRPIPITPCEWAVLRVLVSHAGRIVSSRQLLQEAWGPEYGDETDYVRTYIRRLRNKLEPDAKNPQYILSERGLGYRLSNLHNLR